MVENSSSSLWGQCPVGLLGQMIRRIRTRRRIQFAGRVGGYSVVILVAGMTFGRLWVRDQPSTSASEYNFGGISCTRVLDIAGDYLNGRVDGDLSARIRTHIAACPHCRPIVEKMMRDLEQRHSVMQRYREPSTKSFGMAQPFGTSVRMGQNRRQGSSGFELHSA